MPSYSPFNFPLQEKRELRGCGVSPDIASLPLSSSEHEQCAVQTFGYLTNTSEKQFRRSKELSWVIFEKFGFTAGGFRCSQACGKNSITDRRSGEKNICSSCGGQEAGGGKGHGEGISCRGMLPVSCSLQSYLLQFPPCSKNSKFESINRRAHTG